MTSESDEAKREIRRRVWDLLVAERVVGRGVHGSIPAFVGAEAAADRLAGLPEWRAAEVVKAVPDRAQQPVRERALRDGKLLYVAVPRLAADLPFFVLDPADPTAAPADAASGDHATPHSASPDPATPPHASPDPATPPHASPDPATPHPASSGPTTPPSASPDPATPHPASSGPTTPPHARKVGVEDMRRIDIVVCGSVTVNRRGTRLGKGAGYSDIAVALLQEAGRIGPSTVIVTTVHPLQVTDEPLPETEHDFSVDLIVTPDEVIECEPQRRPSGLYWNNLTAAKIAAIPVLAARAAAARRT